MTEVLSVEKEIGERLRKARESIGLSLDQLQEKTNIQKSFIQAIENGEFSKLPSPFYVRTYLRAYCKCVKIEPHHILRQYRKAEQAERGLTSVHQAITPEMMAQLQQQQGIHGNPNNTMMIHNNGKLVGAGVQNTFSQTGKGTSTSRNSRINMSTALTIAKKPNLPNQQQIHHSETGKFQAETMLSRKTMEQSPKTSYSKKATSPTRLSSTFEQTQNQGKDRARKTVGQSSYQEEKQKQTFQSSTNRTDPTSNRSFRSGRFAANQSKEVGPKTASNPSVLERRKLKSDLSKQEVTKIPKLSRSSVRRNRRSSRSGSFDWTDKKTLIILASLVICIPLLWATVNALATDDEKEKNESQAIMKSDQTETKKEPVPEIETTENENSTTKDENSTEAQIVLTQSSPQLNTYEVSGTDQLNLRFRAEGESWIQVRKQPDPQKEGYLDEATLQSGHEDSYSHNFADGEEIWISLGMPEYVSVTLNGKPIKSSKTIHIKKKAAE